MPRLIGRIRNRRDADGGGEGGLAETLLVGGLVIAFVVVLLGLIFLAVTN